MLFDSDAKAELLSSEALSHERLSVLLETVEKRIVNLYREECTCHWGTGCAQCSGYDVQLDGWEETNQGDPDYTAMDSDLKRALQLCVARVANRQASAPDEHVESESQGERSKTYRARPEIEFTDVAVLRPFDNRSALFSFV